MSSDIHTPTTRAEADELRRQLMTLPDGFLDKFYADLFDSGRRLTHSPASGEKWYKELK